ncbi:MAG: TonB-dependent receptor plug domain-containing protein [Janthinobacterium lividum]
MRTAIAAAAALTVASLYGMASAPAFAAGEDNSSQPASDSSSTSNRASSKAPAAASSNIAGAASGNTAAAAPGNTAAASAAKPAAPARPVRDADLTPTVVSAARAPQPVADAIPNTTVLGQQDIEASGARDIPSLLRLAPGAELVSNGQPGSNTSLFLRGAASNQSLVLIDGVRVEEVSSATTQISQLTLDAIDHVEIVNGNVSALYGSNAIGGLVQIFTKQGGDYAPRGNVQVEYGSYHTQRQTAGVSGAFDASGDTRFSFTASRFQTDGFSSINPQEMPSANPNANGFSDTTVSGTLSHRFNADWTAGVRYFQTNGHVSYDNAFGLPTDLNDSTTQVSTFSAYVDGHPTERWTTHLIAANGIDHLQDYLNGTATDHYDTRNRQFDWRNEFNLTPGNQLLFGYERLNQSLDSNDYATPERQVNSGYIGYNGQLGANSFQFNVRRDQYSDFGGANTYFLGYSYDFNAHWKALANISSAFRAPSFNDLYFPDYGNPALRPERSHSVEAGVQYASDKIGTVRVTAFQTRYHDMIDAQEISLFDYQAANIDSAKVQGIESSWNATIAGTYVRASATFQNPIDETANTVLSRRARRFASLLVSHRFAGWQVGGEFLASAPRSDSGVPLAGYTLLNLTARYDITPSWFVSARIENLLDRNYELAYGYETPRRGAYVTIGWMPH